MHAPASAFCHVQHSSRHPFALVSYQVSRLITIINYGEVGNFKLWISLTYTLVVNIISVGDTIPWFTIRTSDTKHISLHFDTSKDETRAPSRVLV